MKEFLNKNFLGIIVIILGILIYLQRCNDKPEIPKPEIQTKIEYVQQPPIYIPQYVPIPHNVQTPVILPPSYQPSKDLETLIKQYEDLAKKFLEVKTYTDSIELKDTAGKKVGVVTLQDIISENAIKSRNPSYQLNFPHTTTTITKYAPLKNQLYIGGGVLGNNNNLISGVNIGIYLKNKKDQLYGISAQKQVGVPITYGANMYWKIKLKK